MNAVQRVLGIAATAVLAIAVTASAQAQEQQISRKDVPAVVLAAFEKAYPRAMIKGYSKEVEKGQTTYEVESTEGKIHRDVTYTGDGKLISVEESMDINEMPPAVKAAINKRFPGGKILKSEMVTKGNVVGYEFEIEHNGKKTEIAFDAKGNEMKL